MAPGRQSVDVPFAVDARSTWRNIFLFLAGCDRETPRRLCSLKPSREVDLLTQGVTASL
jgi:hypothetical protein